MIARRILSEAKAARLATARGLVLLLQGEGTRPRETVEQATDRGLDAKDLWLVQFPDGNWAAMEPITREEAERRTNGQPPDRTRPAVSTRYEPDNFEEKEPPKKRQAWEGYNACALIRFLASQGKNIQTCSAILPRLGIKGINPATFKIQHRKGRKGEDIPNIPPALCKALNKAAKSG